MTLSEKVSYIKGMMEGMSFEATSAEAKLLCKIVDLLEDMALSIEDLEDETAAIEEFTKEMDEDLSDVEEIVFDEEDDDDWDDDDFDDDDEDWDDDDEDDDIIEAECPVCGETIYFDDTVDPDDVICPNCHKHFTCVCDGDCECCETPCEDAEDGEDEE